MKHIEVVYKRNGIDRELNRDIVKTVGIESDGSGIFLMNMSRDLTFTFEDDLDAEEAAARVRLKFHGTTVKVNVYDHED